MAVKSHTRRTARPLRFLRDQPPTSRSPEPRRSHAETRRLRGQGLTHREIAERLDVSVSTVANDLRSSPGSSSGANSSAPTERHETPQRTKGAADTLLRPVRAVARAARRRLP
jgi:DNA invertase Pin-like site-specific DNA recombinase